MEESNSFTRPVTQPPIHSIARVEKRTGEFVCPSRFGLVCCAACIVTRTSTAIVQMTPNKSDTMKVAKLNCVTDRLSHSAYSIVIV
jgi:hypothetical protein